MHKLPHLDAHIHTIRIYTRTSHTWMHMYIACVYTHVHTYQFTRVVASVTHNIVNCMCTHVPAQLRHPYIHMITHTAMPIIIEGRFQVFQQFSSSKLVLKTVESCFVALNYYGNGSTFVYECVCTHIHACIGTQAHVEIQSHGNQFLTTLHELPHSSQTTLLSACAHMYLHT